MEAPGEMETPGEMGAPGAVEISKSYAEIGEIYCRMWYNER